jgi:hypothetical protein
MIRFKTPFLFVMSVLLCMSEGFAQSNDEKGSRIILGSSASKASFHVYNPAFLAKKIYTDTLQAINETPEQLMCSLISARSQVWVNYNTLGGEVKAEKRTPAYFEKYNQMDKESNFYELKAKYEFTANGSDYAIVKFYIHFQGMPKPLSACYQLQKLGKRWYYTSADFTADLVVLIMRFDENLLNKVMVGKITGDKPTDDLIKKVHDQNGLNLNKLNKEFKQWYESNDTKKLSYFVDKNAW